MLNLYNSLGDCSKQDILCESFSDPRLYQINKDLQKYGYNFNKIFGIRFIQWDKLTSADIEEYDKDDVEELIKDVRKLTRANSSTRPFILIGMLNEKLNHIYIVYSEAMLFFRDSYSNTGKKCIEWRSRCGKYSLKKNDIFDYMRGEDYILKIYIDEKSASALRKERRNNREGSWELTADDHKSQHLKKGELGVSVGGRSDYVDSYSFYGKCQQLARDIQKKYREIISKRKLNNLTDTTEVDNKVKHAVDEFMKFTLKFNQNPKDYNKSAMSDLFSIMHNHFSYYKNGLYELVKGGLLGVYQEYCDAMYEVNQSLDKDVDINTYYGRSNTALLDKIKTYKQHIDEGIKLLNSSIEELEKSSK